MSNQERRLMRRIERQGGNAQTRGGLFLPQGSCAPQDEQDGRRDRLAERLLEIGLESARMDGFTDTAEKPVGSKGYDTEPVITLEQWYLKHATAALAAAEVLYPELPEPGAVGSQPLPAAAQAGAQSVGGWPQERASQAGATGDGLAQMAERGEG